MGRLIVFEGIDGSGKSTQFKILCDRLEKENIGFKRLVFPQYSKESSALPYSSPRQYQVTGI